MSTHCIDLPTNLFQLIDCATYKVRINGDLGPGVPDKSDVVCWHCCHKFDTPPVFIPIKVDTSTKVWTLKGVFCSLACLKAFLIEEDTYARDSQILWAKKFASQYMDVPMVIKRAPSRFVLKMFGGNMDIETFRSTKHKYLNLVTPVIVKPLEEIMVTLPKKVHHNHKACQANLSTGIERCPKKYPNTKRGNQTAGTLANLMVSYFNAS